MFALWNKTIIVCSVVPRKITKVWERECLLERA